MQLGVSAIALGLFIDIPQVHGVARYRDLDKVKQKPPTQHLLEITKHVFHVLDRPRAEQPEIGLFYLSKNR